MCNRKLGYDEFNHHTIFATTFLRDKSVNSQRRNRLSGEEYICLLRRLSPYLLTTQIVGPAGVKFSISFTEFIEPFLYNIFQIYKGH